MKTPILILASLLAIPVISNADTSSIEGTVEAKPAKYLKDTVVYIKKVDGVKLSAQTVTIDQKGMEFSPHVALLAIGDSVMFDNHDKVDHNVSSPEGNYDLGSWGEGKTKTQQFTKEGMFSQVCKLHPEMLAYVFVGQNRFATVVDTSGKFTLTNVPAGSYELDVWNPKLKAAPVQITVVAGKATSVHFALAR